MAHSQNIPVKLQLLTPLHIGGASGNLMPIEFVAFDGRVYVISEVKWMQVLKAKGWTTDFLNYVRPEENKRASLSDFLRQQRCLNATFFQEHDMARYSSTSAHTPKQDLRPFVRDGLDQPFIPGSAIKGALRTAILFAYLKELKQQCPDRFEDLVVNPIRNMLADRTIKLKDKKASLGRHLTPTFLQSFALSGAKEGPHKDLFKTLSIADVGIQTLDKNSLIVEQVKVLSLDASQPNGWRYSTGRQRTGDRRPGPRGGFSVFPECLSLKLNVTVEVRFDVEMFNGFREDRRSGDLEVSLRQFILNKAKELYPNQPLDAKVFVKTLLAVAEQSAQHWVREEIDFFSKIKDVEPILELYKDQNFTPTLRLGWGTGVRVITMYTLLPNDIQDSIKEIFMKLLAPDALRKYPSEFAVFPKTRRVITSPENGLPKTVLGWVRLEAL